MKRGYKPRALISGTQLLAIGTGSDHCTEHECGSKPLLSRFTTAPHGTNSEDIAKAILRNELSSVPSLISFKTLNRNLSDIKLIESATATMIGCGRESSLNFKNPELAKSPTEQFSGAWDEDSFGFVAYEPKHREALRAFHARILEGKVVFSGLFMDNAGLSGVILADISLLESNYQPAIKAAQREFNLKVDLHKKSRVDELNAIRIKHTRSFVYIWPVWNPQGTGALYNINPMGEKAEHGLYTFDELKAWFEAKGSYILKPTTR